MLQYRQLALVAAVLSVAACAEQEEQTLPFDPATTTSAQGTVSGTGTVTLASGAEVFFPAGALSGSSQITISRVANPTLPAGIGTAIGGQSIQIAAAGGASLVNPAQLTLLASQVQSDPNGWLADFAITNGGTTEIASDVGVDISNGRIIGNIPSFGTITPVIPPASELIAVSNGIPAASVVGDAPAAELFTGAVRTISQDCRARAAQGNTIPACTGFTASASGSLLSQVGEARLARPRIQGTITLTGDPRVAPGATASGSITIRAVVRVRQAGTSAGGVGARIPIEVSLTANANSRVVQAAQTNILTLNNFTVAAARPAVASAPVTFQIVPTSATGGAFVFNGTVSLGNNTTGQIQARFPFTIGY
ncbi:MAG: hypothetical protein MUF53_09780 [Gemmatimonadaceae bacterium]|jgi:hypothetical protein|nr:hypothetical protein [Gemmatimonadaceae bacterium]